MSFNYQFPEDRIDVITAVITGWEGRGQIGRDPGSCSQGNHRLFSDPLVSQDGDVHLSDMVLTRPETGQTWDRCGRN